jgi:hypothetical protein
LLFEEINALLKELISVAVLSYEHHAHTNVSRSTYKVLDHLLRLFAQKILEKFESLADDSVFPMIQVTSSG